MKFMRSVVMIGEVQHKIVLGYSVAVLTVERVSLLFITSKIVLGCRLAVLTVHRSLLRHPWVSFGIPSRYSQFFRISFCTDLSDFPESFSASAYGRRERP